MTYREWDGREWQEYCLQLLRARYSDHTLQEVPDRHKGDLGIEAFTQNGVAFQCYAAREPVEVKKLYEDQRDKLTEDLGKLRKNANDFQKLLGSVVVRSYVFMVHRHESRELIAHAQRSALVVRGWALPFIDESFTVTVETDANYPVERAQVWSVPERLVDLQGAPRDVRELWQQENASLLDSARGKLECIGLTGAALDTYLEQLLNQYLKGENALDSLRSRYPDNWRAVSRTKSEKEEVLTLEYPPGAATAPSHVRQVASDLAREIMRDAPSLSESVSRVIAWSAVADWLMRCPLDFEEAP